MRVLKPGGYLDFSVIDSDIMNAGPLGLAKSVEFGFSLKTLGYDPNPTRLFLGRLGRAGFEEVRRAWMCLPMGHTKLPVGEKPLPVVRDSSGVDRSFEAKAILQGSTEGAAGIAGLAGGWAWERWLLRCEMEKVAGEGRLWLDAAEVREAGKCLEGVHDVVEEGRSCGAGYRMLNASRGSRGRRDELSSRRRDIGSMGVEGEARSLQTTLSLLFDGTRGHTLYISVGHGFV